MGKVKVRISDESVNCYGTRVLTSGIDYSKYQENSVLLWMHDRSRGVVGKVEHLEMKGGELLGELVFDEASALSVQLKKQYDFGSMKMVSANFRILETSDDKSLVMEGQTRQTVTRCELFEVSCVDIGGNDHAMVLSDSEGNALRLSEDEGASVLLPLLNDSNNNPLKKVTEMETKTLALLLGLKETATEAEIQEAIKNLQLNSNQAQGLDDKVAQLEKQLKEMNDHDAEVKLAAITQAVDTAIQEKRLDAKMKDQFVELGKNVGIGTLKLTLAAMQPQGKVSAVVNRGADGHVQRVGAGSYQKLSEVPADEMLELRDNRRDEYIKLFKAEFGFEPDFQ